MFQATTGKIPLRTSCLYIRNGKLDTELENEKQERKVKNCFGW